MSEYIYEITNKGNYKWVNENINKSMAEWINDVSILPFIQSFNQNRWIQLIIHSSILEYITYYICCTVALYNVQYTTNVWMNEFLPLPVVYKSHIKPT